MAEHHVEAVTVPVRNGAKRNSRTQIKNVEGKAALQYAQELNNKELIKLLI